MNKVDLLALIARLLQQFAVDNDGRVDTDEPAILSTSFDCDHKSAELFVCVQGDNGPVEYVISTEGITVSDS